MLAWTVVVALGWAAPRLPVPLYLATCPASSVHPLMQMNGAGYGGYNDAGGRTAARIVAASQQAWMAKSATSIASLPHSQRGRYHDPHMPPQQQQRSTAASIVARSQDAWRAKHAKPTARAPTRYYGSYGGGMASPGYNNAGGYNTAGYGAVPQAGSEAPPPCS